MKHIVFAIVGMPGAGKSEVARLFAELGIPVVRFGDVTEEEIRRQGIPQTPATEKAVREEIRAREGMDAYAKRNVPRIDEGLERAHVAADGLYSWPEFLHLRETYGERLRVVAVLASPRIRYERLAARPVRPHTAGEAWMRDVAEIESIQKAGPIAMADHTLVNEGDLQDLARAFGELWASVAQEAGS
ncbi:MAG: AAA family ATPase [Planctomycetota bacterium]|jgi:dephospho-CoA kinase